MIGVNVFCNVYLQQTVVFIGKVIEEQCSYLSMNLDMSRLEATSSIDSIDWKIEKNNVTNVMFLIDFGTYRCLRHFLVL